MLSGLVILQLRTEPARFKVRLQVDMTGLEVWACTKGVAGDVVPRWIVLDVRPASGLEVVSNGPVSP